MNELFKLVRGNPVNLEGRGVIYSKFRGEHLKYVDEEILEILSQEGLELKPEGGIFSLYVSLDPKEIVKRNPKCENSMQINMAVSNEMNLNKNPSISSAPVFYESEKEIMDEEGDILFMGNWANPILMRKAASIGYDLYSDMFIEQHMIKDAERKSKASPSNESSLESIVADASKGLELPKWNGDISGLINGQYIGRMIDYARRGETLEFEKVKGQLVMQTKESPYASDILKICNIAASKGEINLKLIEYIIGKITAIHEQNFEMAAHYRDRIRSVESKL